MCASKRQKLLRSGQHGDKKASSGFMVDLGPQPGTKKNRMYDQTLPIPLYPPHQLNIAQESSSENGAPARAQSTSESRHSSRHSGYSCKLGEGPRDTLCAIPITQSDQVLSQLSLSSNMPFHLPRMFFLCFLNGIPSYPSGPSLNMMPSSPPSAS